MVEKITIGGQLDFGRSRKLGSAKTVIGGEGQILRGLQLYASENCAVTIYPKKKESISQEVLDRLADRHGLALHSYILHKGSCGLEIPDLLQQLPIEIRVMGAPEGKLSYQAFIEVIK